MNEIKIVQYNESLAQKVADMWNDSADGWGGGDTIRTGEDVARSEANSENTNLYLAMEGDLVVGYCGLSEYKFDEDTMYIPLLNVRPTHHGKKIGKKLLLKALDRVIELGWPRLDLFTWAGNTKAVPLYKKCGFFWEEMDQSTHLMNFIPTVLSTEALKDYFKELSWYDHGARTIEVKPDGLKENQFEYYEYTWVKDHVNLKVQFERKGRGLRLVETDDYLVCATVEKLNLVFGRKYQVEYKVVNKSGKNLTIDIEGFANKNVDNSFTASAVVETDTTISNQFFVGEIKEEQNDFKTHPAVAARIKINGKEATFKVGIIPEFPAKLTFRGDKELCYLGKKGEFYLDIENKFDETAYFTFEVPSTSLVEIKEKQIEVELAKGERKSVSLHYVLNGFEFYSPNLQVQVSLENGEKISFTKQVGYGFKGLNARFFGETEKYWEMYNGKFVLAMEKLDNWQIPTRNEDDGQITAFMPPKIGKPYYDEFGKKAPEHMNFYEKDGKAVLEYIFKSDKRSGIWVKTIHQLHQNGVLETNYEVLNKGQDALEDIFLASPVLHNLGRGVLPLKSGIVELNDSVGAGYSYWCSKELNENWIFAKSKDIPRGLSWPKEFECEFNGWHLTLTANVGKLASNKSIITKPIFTSVGAFDTWQEFRSFALEHEQITRPKTIDSIIVDVNGGNPFVEEEVKVSVKELKTPYLDGKVTVNIGDVSQGKVVKAEEKIKEVNFKIPSYKGINHAVINLDLASLELNKERVLFKKGSESVQFNVVDDEGHKVFVADNGVIKIKAAPTFAANLFSLEYEGKEWLDSSFPEVKPKSWWSPWQGGLFSRPDGLIVRSIQKEKVSADFAELRDEHGNNWCGLKITVDVTEHEKFKGMKYHQYYLMLPGVPIVCQLAEIEQNMGTFLNVQWAESGFFKVDEDINSCFLKYKNSVGEWVKNKAGQGAFDGEPNSTVTLESKNQTSLIHFISDIQAKKQTVSLNKEVVFLSGSSSLNAKDGEKVKVQPNFYVLTDKRIDELALKDLLNLRF